MKTYPNPAFRSHAFTANVTEGVWPGGISRLHRNLVRHGRRVSYERLGTDPWQLQSGLWVATEPELAELKAAEARDPWRQGDEFGLFF